MMENHGKQLPGYPKCDAAPPKEKCTCAPVAWLPHVKAQLNTWATNLDSRGGISDTPLTTMAEGLRLLAKNPGQFLVHPEDVLEQT